ncbi:MAG TPA: HAD hydrolase family protein, partial [Clostridiales bacterium]|nr:HAD hydrolase family protein [Clostridiales bacterium]
TRDMIYLVKPRLFGKVFTLIDSLDHKVCHSLFEVPGGDWGKITFFDKPQNIGEINSLVNRELNLGIKSVPTSRFTLEIINKNTDKGNALKKLAQMLSVDMKNTAAIGDYYNDLDMLKAVAVPACCAKAPPKVKAVSKYCACDANKGAVADFICYLTENYIANDL